jgi:hypothetical protein
MPDRFDRCFGRSHIRCRLGGVAGLARNRPVRQIGRERPVGSHNLLGACMSETEFMSQLTTAGNNAKRLKLLADQVIEAQRSASREQFTSQAQPL